MDDDFKTYLFRYRFEGREWGLDIKAASEEEAKRRLSALAFAQYDGELVATIPGIAPRVLMNPIMSVLVAIRNYFRRDSTPSPDRT